MIFLATLVASTALLTAQDADEGCAWLSKTVPEFFNQSRPQHFREITTDRYAEYKQDAIGVVYATDNSLTEEQFEEKWSDIYDTSYAGIGRPFLIDQQDWGNVVVSQCELISQPEPGTFIVHATIEDTMFERTHANEIAIVQTDMGFRIDDVKRQE